MKKFTSIFLYVLTGTAIVSGIGLSSCSKDGDKEPEVKPKLSFATDAVTVNEDDGSMEVELVLDKAASEDIVVSYELSGSAQDLHSVTNAGDADYEITSDYLEVTIEKGETSGIIEINLLPDFRVEDDETIDISITEVDSDKIEITRDDEVVVTMEQEQNGIFVALSWDDEAYTDVDLDLLLRVTTIGGNVAAQDVAWGSVSESVQSGEAIFIPKSINNALFGASYTYYAGTANPMNFKATFIDVVNGVLEGEADRVSYDGQYTLDNINKWTNVNTTKVAQTFEVVAGVFKNFSEIVAPDAGSRIDMSGNASSVTRQNNGFGSSQKLQTLIKKQRLQ